MFIDAVVPLGEEKNFTVSINQRTEDEKSFEPLDLSEYSIRFRVLGAPTANAKVLIEHIITQNTDEQDYGQIYDATGGEFSFGFTADETISLGLGEFAIEIVLLDATTGQYIDNLTEGNENAEFNKIRIVEV